jgi:hypothetical protein
MPDLPNNSRFPGTAFLAGCLNSQNRQKNGFDFIGEWVLDRGEMTI